MVFDQDADKSLQGADDGPMQHHRDFSRIIFGNVFSAQSGWYRKIDLHGAALPGTTDRILEVILYFRPVKCAFSRQLLPNYVTCAQSLAQGIFGPIPDFIGANALFRAQGKFDRDVLESKVFVDVERQLNAVHSS